MRSILFLVIAAALITSPAVAADFTVTTVPFVAYVINGVENPVLTLHRGITYTFSINASGHPFWIKTVQSIGTANAYNDGVTNNGIENGTLTFAVPMTAPNTLYYNCEFHAPMTNMIEITTLAIEERSWSTIKAMYH